MCKHIQEQIELRRKNITRFHMDKPAISETKKRRMEQEAGYPNPDWDQRLDWSE